MIDKFFYALETFLIIENYIYKGGFVIKNLWNEINELKVVERSLKAQIAEKDVLLDRYYADLKRKTYIYPIPYYMIEDRRVQNEIAIIRHLIRELEAEYGELIIKLCDCRNKISELRHEYRILHTNDFYRPMDDYDLQEYIKHNGSIIGTKL